MRSTPRRVVGSLLMAFGVAAGGVGVFASPAAADFEGVCTTTDASSGTCVVDEPNGNNADTHGTAAYVIDGTSLTFDFDGVIGGTDIQACVTVDSGQPNPYIEPADNNGAWQPCAGASADRIFEGDYVDPLVLDLTAVSGWKAGSAVFFAVHVNQSGMTTYVIGGGTPSDPGDDDACVELDGVQPLGTDCTPEPEDACVELDGVQPLGTDCTPEPEDACVELDGVQPLGTDCTPEPEDACVELDGVQPLGTDCTPEPEDACDDLAGVQAAVLECDPVIEEDPEPEVKTVAQELPTTTTTSSTTTSTPTTPTSLPTEVQGVQQTRELPRTGAGSQPLLAVAVALLLSGFVLVAIGGRRGLAGR